jgi:diacylglycerol kinase
VHALTAVEAATQMDNFVTFSEITPVITISIFVHLSLSDSREYLIIVSCICTLLMRQIINSAIPRVGVTFHFKHLPNFGGVNSLGNLLSFLDTTFGDGLL